MKSRPPSLKLIRSNPAPFHDGNQVTTKTTRHHVQLVVTPTPSSTQVSPQSSRKPEQLSLFDAGERVLLGIVNVERIRGIQFATMLREIRPKWLIDLRIVPHFLIDRLNRLAVFDIFDECHIEYIHIMSTLNILSREDASLSSGRIAQGIMQRWHEKGATAVLGSIIFLVDDDETAQQSAMVLPEQLKPRPKAGWDTRFLN